MDNNTVRALVDSGIHFGHRVGRWNPKMKPYIFCTRNSIHIIDIKETVKGLVRARKFIASIVASGKDVLFVGTKRQARTPIIKHATECGMPYVCERWLGGTLTNFSTIRKRLGRLEELETMDDQGLMASQSKKMESTLRRELRKIKRNLDGIRDMEKMPGALIIIDAGREHLAVAEARNLKIPTICLLDTDSDPDLVDIPIPGNDDAMRSIEIVLNEIKEAVRQGKEGQAHQEKAQAAEAAQAKGRSRRVTTSQLADETVAPETGSTPETDAEPETAAAPAETTEN